MIDIDSQLIQLEDGCWYWWPPNGAAGAYSQHYLECVVKELQIRNESYYESLEQYYVENPPPPIEEDDIPF